MQEEADGAWILRHQLMNGDAWVVTVDGVRQLAADDGVAAEVGPEALEDALAVVATDDSALRIGQFGVRGFPIGLEDFAERRCVSVIDAVQTDVTAFDKCLRQGSFDALCIACVDACLRDFPREDFHVWAVRHSPSAVLLSDGASRRGMRVGAFDHDFLGLEPWDRLADDGTDFRDDVCGDACQVAGNEQEMTSIVIE